MSEVFEYKLSDTEQRVLHLWNTGIETQLIREATGLSGGAITRMMHRLQLANVPVVSRARAAEATPYVRKTAEVREVATKPLPSFANVAAEGGIPFDDAADNRQVCKWPLWGLDKTKGNVCGHPVTVLAEGTPHEKTSPYCAAHHRRAYPPSIKQK